MEDEGRPFIPPQPCRVTAGLVVGAPLCVCVCVSPQPGCPAEDGGSSSDGHTEAFLEHLLLPNAGVPDHLEGGA